MAVLYQGSIQINTVFHFLSFYKLHEIKNLLPHLLFTYCNYVRKSGSFLLQHINPTTTERKFSLRCIVSMPIKTLKNQQENHNSHLCSGKLTSFYVLLHKETATLCAPR